MSRRKSKSSKKSVPIKKNKLTIALESGGKVEGLKGFCQTTLKSNDGADYDNGIETSVIIAIECVRVDARDCGVKVFAKPKSGKGEFTISPCQWFDSPPDVEKELARRATLELANETVRNIMHSTLISDNKRRLLNFLQEHENGTEMMQRLREEAEERWSITEKTKDNGLLRKASKNEVKNLAVQFVADSLDIEDHTTLSASNCNYY